MARKRRDWTDTLRLRLWSEEVFARSGCATNHQADKFFGPFGEDSSDRPRLFERVRESGLMPSAQHVALIATKPGFEDTAEIFDSPMWTLLRHPLDSKQEVDNALEQVMSAENLFFPDEVQWERCVSAFIKRGIASAMAHSLVVEAFAKQRLGSVYARNAYVLLNLYRSQVYRQHDICECLSRAMDTAFDRFFHHEIGGEEGREFYQLALDRTIGRAVPAVDYSLLPTLFTPPMPRDSSG